jgi:hypothetical protein
MPTIGLNKIKYNDEQSKVIDKINRNFAAIEQLIANGHLDSSNIAEIDANKVRVLNLIVGGNVEMGPDATITWGQVTSQPQIISEDMVTTITENTIETATIRANQITTGTLSGIYINGVYITGAQIDISEDVNIGDFLYLNGSNFLSGIRWKNSSGTTVAEIYIDPASGAMFLETDNGGVYVNGTRVDQGAVFA